MKDNLKNLSISDLIAIESIFDKQSQSKRKKELEQIHAESVEIGNQFYKKMAPIIQSEVDSILDDFFKWKWNLFSQI